MPRKKTHEELMREVKVKKSWTGSGAANDLFDKKLPIMKPKILDEWSMIRIQQPERAYKKFFFCTFSLLIIV